MPEGIGHHWIDLAGYSASALVFLAFYMKTMIPLRLVGIASNLAFITYAIGAQLYPVLILHTILLPLNCLRLFQMRALIRKVHDAHGTLSMEWLTPFMRRRTLTKGDVLFKKGDQATELYVMLSGSIRLVDIGVTVGAGSVLGEISQRLGCADGKVLPRGAAGSGHTKGARYAVWASAATRLPRIVQCASRVL